MKKKQPSENEEKATVIVTIIVLLIAMYIYIKVDNFFSDFIWGNLKSFFFGS